jgi:hypothetical protein
MDDGVLEFEYARKAMLLVDVSSGSWKLEKKVPTTPLTCTMTALFLFLC